MKHLTTDNSKYQEVFEELQLIKGQNQAIKQLVG
jgi:hypothetical protein